MIIILEGISRTGKSSWFARNVKHLEGLFAPQEVTYSHIHKTRAGEFLLKEYNRIKNSESPNRWLSLSLKYVQAHLDYTIRMSEVDPYELLVLDRSLISTYAITFSKYLDLAKDKDIKIFPSLAEYIFTSLYTYMEYLFDKADGVVFIIWFDGGKENPRYAGMELAQKFYQEYFETSGIPSEYIIRVDANLSPEEVDAFVLAKMKEIGGRKNEVAKN